MSSMRMASFLSVSFAPILGDSAPKANSETLTRTQLTHSSRVSDELFGLLDQFTIANEQQRPLVQRGLTS